MTTDHVKIWLNNSQFIGLVVKPYSYRVNFAPTFFPRFSVGDTKGLDQTRWRSWMQSRFDEGEGQLLWSSGLSTNRYAQGHLVEVGRPHIAPGGADIAGLWGQTPVNYGVAGDREDSVVGDIGTALFPQETSQGTLRMLPQGNTAIAAMATYFTDKYPTFVLEWSGRPMIWHWKSAWWYTGVADPVAWSGGAAEGYATKMTGKWQQVFSHSNVAQDFWISGAVVYSQTVHVSFKGAYSTLWKFGTVHTLGATAATMIQPAYATFADRLTVYDEKLWRSVAGEIHYLEPSAGTIAAHWEDLLPGSMLDHVLNMREFNGRLYIGKANALWTFDAGRLYRVEDFSAYHDNWNFSHMTVHRGYMYFNVKHMLFRLSTAGTMEQVQSYPMGGVIVDAASVGPKLYYLAREPGPAPNTDVWVFDPETGGNFRMFSTERLGRPDHRSPRSMDSAYGVLMITPFVHTASNASLNAPIVTIDPITPPIQQAFPGYATKDSWFVTSMLDFGLPMMMKTFNKITVDYELQGQVSDYFKVYYVNELTQHLSLTNSFEGKDIAMAVPTYPATKDDTIIDGDLTTGRTFSFGPSKDYDYWLVGVKSPIGAAEGTSQARPDVFGFRFIAEWNDASFGTDPKDDIARAFKVFGIDPSGAWVDMTDTCSLVVAKTTGSRIVIQVKFIPNNGRLMRNMSTSAAATATLADARGSQNWWALKSTYATGFTLFKALEIILIGANEPIPLANLNWQLLGTVGGYADPTTSEVHNTRKALNFPVDCIGQQLMLKFELYGSKVSRPTIRRYEVEWMPAPSHLQIYNFTLPVAENIELPNLEIRSNATSVVATVFSLACAGRPYVCQLPWPGTHTLRGLISIVAPGGVVPSLRDDNVDNSNAEVPIQIDQV